MFGLNIDPRNDKGDPSSSDLWQLGLKLARFQYTYKYSPASTLHFYTGEVKKLYNNKVRSLIIIDYGSLATVQPHINDDDRKWDRYISELAKVAKQVAGQFQQYNPAYEIWNEPDDKHTTGNYRPRLKEAVFGRMLTACHDAIKKATNNKGQVIVGGLDSGDPKWFQTVLNGLNGSMPFDAVGVHPYHKQPDRSGWSCKTANTGYAGDLLVQYYNMTHKPVWVTECGVGIGGTVAYEQAQAEYLKRFYQDVEQHQSHYVKEVVWFCYSDAMGLASESHHWGLKSGNGREKPAYKAYQALRKW
ncbi:MAG: cellulase family glycosylhydrolase [Candidatus Promineifilaceae bacterium]